jgi:hypothetical protein
MRDDIAKALVLALLGVALGGSIITVLLTVHRLVTEPQRVETIGLLLLFVLILNAWWMIKIVHAIWAPRYTRRRESSEHVNDVRVPIAVERATRQGLRHYSTMDLAHIAASADLDDWYRRIVHAELRCRKGRGSRLTMARAAAAKFLLRRISPY